MCSDGWDRSEDAVGECPDCGKQVDEDGDAVVGCNYSSCTCPTCGSRPCDGSC